MDEYYYIWASGCWVPESYRTLEEAKRAIPDAIEQVHSFSHVGDTASVCIMKCQTVLEGEVTLELDEAWDIDNTDDEEFSNENIEIDE